MLVRDLMELEEDSIETEYKMDSFKDDDGIIIESELEKFQDTIEI